MHLGPSTSHLSFYFYHILPPAFPSTFTLLRLHFIQFAFPLSICSCTPSLRDLLLSFPHRIYSLSFLYSNVILSFIRSFDYEREEEAVQGGWREEQEKERGERVSNKYTSSICSFFISMSFSPLSVPLASIEWRKP